MIQFMAFRDVSSGVCTCAETEFAALEPLYGAVHAQQGLAAPAPAHTETPLLD